MAIIIMQFASFSLPKVNFSFLEKELGNKEWKTFRIGIRTERVEKKQLLTHQVRDLASKHSFFENKKHVFGSPDVELLFDEVDQKIHMTIFPVIVLGRYLKLKRGIAQTKHFCFKCKGQGCDHCNHSGVLTKESVQELISPFFMEAFGCDEVLFHGSGREDVDVRMLGNGRPFALTLENPSKRNVDLSFLENRINNSLESKAELSCLIFGDASDVARTATPSHSKKYRALVECESEPLLTSLQSFLKKKTDILQTTPVRVEKRRVMKDRPHWVVLEKIIPIDSTHFELEVHASSGLYIKEFISGDESRTKPSIFSLLKVPCSCKELDVMEILDD
jgi:tRNA pseudouridine synthase 10